MSGDLLIYLMEENRKLTEERDSLARVVENMETQHVTFTSNNKEFHPDWCRECRVDKLIFEKGILIKVLEQIEPLLLSAAEQGARGDFDGAWGLVQGFLARTGEPDTIDPSEGASPH